MAELEALLDVAAALADGRSVDWDAASRLTTSDAERTLLAELRFIATITRGSSAADSPGTADPKQWGPLAVIERVGHGTFGDIYRAWDNRLDREVALKVLRRRDGEDENGPSTAIQEGRLLARVRHPNVVTVYGAERVDGQVGVWMEYINGRTLEQELAELGPFAVDRVIAIGMQLADALSTVHRADVIHRDVKAQNVMVDREGRLVLTDFGAGVELEEFPESGVREVAGTPLCVAPEVLAGEPATPRSDIYSLGVLLYHLLTGDYPVRGRSLKEVREAHASGNRITLAATRSDLPRGLVEAIDRALDPDPRDRHTTADAFAAALGGHFRTQPPVWARWRLAAIAAALLVVSSPGLPLRNDAAQPTVTAIEFPDAMRTDAFAINDAGVIVGSYEDSGKITHGFMLRDGIYTTIDVPQARRTRPTGLGNDGTVVGDFDDAAGSVHGFVRRAGAFSVIDFPGATYTRVNDLNNLGAVVGDYKDAHGRPHGFLLSDGTFSTIDVPGAFVTRAIGLNDDGDIVGDFQDGVGEHGFLMAQGRFTTIDAPGATLTQAFGVNALRAIVGGFGFPARRSFLLANGNFRVVEIPEALRTTAAGISSSGSIVGSYLSGAPPKHRGFLLTP